MPTSFFVKHFFSKLWFRRKNNNNVHQQHLHSRTSRKQPLIAYKCFMTPPPPPRGSILTPYLSQQQFSATRLPSTQHPRRPYQHHTMHSPPPILKTIPCAVMGKRNTRWIFNCTTQSCPVVTKPTRAFVHASTTSAYPFPSTHSLPAQSYLMNGHLPWRAILRTPLLSRRAILVTWVNRPSTHPTHSASHPVPTTPHIQPHTCTLPNDLHHLSPYCPIKTCFSPQ